ncbi:MAG TPA: hypothetical protein DIW52_22115, partial [Pseudomonas sp.]|nr:hypothetical protein [Pseudomonas sp.]
AIADLKVAQNHVGASLLANAVAQPTLVVTDPPHSRAGSLPQLVLRQPKKTRSASLLTGLFLHLHRLSRWRAHPGEPDHVRWIRTAP